MAMIGLTVIGRWRTLGLLIIEMGIVAGAALALLQPAGWFGPRGGGAAERHGAGSGASAPRTFVPRGVTIPVEPQEGPDTMDARSTSLITLPMAAFVVLRLITTVTSRE